MLMVLTWLCVGALLATIYFLLTHRRRTPYLDLNLDALPTIEDGLQTLAGVTGGSVYG